MNGPADIFREIHRLRRLTRDVQEQIGRLPRQLQAQQAKVARQEQLLREAQDEIKRLKVSAHEKEVALRATHNQIAKHERQLNEAESKKEYDALRQEVTAEKEKVARLEDEILNAISEGEEKTARLPELERAVKEAKEEFGRFEQDMGRRRTDLEEQLRQGEQQLKEAEAQVPEKLRPQYERVVASMGPEGMAAVQGRTCSACYTEITAQNYNELLQQQFVVCKSCGRILYLPEEVASRS